MRISDWSSDVCSSDLAATRVLAVSIVRDRFAGRAMAKVMSLTFIVFLAVPMLAPTLGQAILLFAPWRWIFGLLALSGLAVLLWVFIRLPETLHPANRLAISLQIWIVAWLTVVCECQSVGDSFRPDEPRVGKKLFSTSQT